MAKNTGKSTDNLKPAWKKGETGNPNGRPKGQRNYATIYREALEKIANTKGMTADEIETMIEEVGILKAMKGDFNFQRDIKDRLHGKAVNKTDITSGGEGIQPLLVKIIGDEGDADSSRV